MYPIFFRPGQQVKVFTLYRKQTNVDAKGRVAYSAHELPVETFKGTISQSSPKEREQYHQMGHPISHTITVQGRTTARAEDTIGYEGRFFTVQGKHDPAEIGAFSILYCNERNGVGA